MSSTIINNTYVTAEAIAKLLHPFAEVLVHDVQSNKILAIYNSFSKRQVGDDSLLTQDELGSLGDTVGPYPKTNWDGRPLKSVSNAIRDEQGNLIALLCINLDVSHLQQQQKLLAQFLGHDMDVQQPSALFADDWHERINQYVAKYLQKQQSTLAILNRTQKKELVLQLFADGAFNTKNAANYVANVLGISRATVYKYLNG